MRRFLQAAAYRPFSSLHHLRTMATNAKVIDGTAIAKFVAFAALVPVCRR